MVTDEDSKERRAPVLPSPTITGCVILGTALNSPEPRSCFIKQEERRGGRRSELSHAPHGKRLANAKLNQNNDEGTHIALGKVSEAPQSVLSMKQHLQSKVIPLPSLHGVRFPAKTKSRAGMPATKLI